MKKTCYIGWLFLFCLSVSCTRPMTLEEATQWQENGPRVVRVDSLLQQNPDSALAYLEGLSDIGNGGVGNPYNHYLELLHSEAAFKVRREVTHCDEVDAAMAYFDSVSSAFPVDKDMAFLSARTHYMKGICVNNGFIFDNDSTTMLACLQYYQALQIMESHFSGKEITGHKASFVALVYSRLANIYSDKFLIEPTIHFYKQVLTYKMKASTTPNLANTHFFLGYEFEKSEQYDSALYYYNQSFSSIKDTTGVLYRNVINRMAISSYQVNHDGEASIKALKHIALTGQDFERNDRYLGIGYLYMLEEQYDSAVVYLHRVFDEAPNMFLKTQSAEHLYNIYEQKDDTEKANEFARFVTQNTPPEFGTKADEWRYTNLFQEYLQQKQGNARFQEARQTQYRMQGLLLSLLLLLAVAVVWILVNRKKKKALSGRLQEQGEALSEMQKRIQAASFLEEPICRQILEVVNEQQFKSKIDYRFYKDYALSKEQLLALREASDCHFGQFTSRIRKDYPALTKGDIDYCCLYLLGLEETDAAALMQRAYNTVCDRSRKMKSIFGSDDPLPVTLRKLANSHQSAPSFP